MYRDQKVVVVMPAYNAELTLEKTFRDIPEGSVDDIILTDDASSDNTVEIARRLAAAEPDRADYQVDLAISLADRDRVANRRRKGRSQVSWNGRQASQQ